MMAEKLCFFFGHSTKQLCHTEISCDASANTGSVHSSNHVPTSIPIPNSYFKNSQKLEIR